MAKISLKDLRHTYESEPESKDDWALKRMSLDWADGGAYALLGPSGCGKTTLLNIISGLVTPTEGQVFFGDEEVTTLPPERRNIAQVFQFPVIYDTMTVHDNLAFPLRNHGMPRREIEGRVKEIARMLDLEGKLGRRAAGMTADEKQKISLGRGLVRANVNVIMFDEPLTVIDPHLKWVVRSKLKELHQQVGVTMIYVTHDQTEALTFADQVVVMHEGTIVQVGTPVELFERPRHTFVGHFIGSPGMNVVPCNVENGIPRLAGINVPTEHAVKPPAGTALLELGVRPEFVKLADDGIPVRITKVSDAGRYSIVETELEEVKIRLLVPEGKALPAETAHITLDPRHTHVYADGWIVS